MKIRILRFKLISTFLFLTSRFKKHDIKILLRF